MTDFLEYSLEHLEKERNELDNEIERLSDIVKDIDDEKHKARFTYLIDKHYRRREAITNAILIKKGLPPEGTTMYHRERLFS